MKPLFILPVIIILLSGSANAQPVITTSWLPQVGDTFNMQPVVTNGVSLGTTGPNQVWDYATLVDSGSIEPEIWVFPSDSNYDPLCPSANLAGIEPGEGINYFNVSADTLFRIGVTISDSESIYSVYKNWHDNIFPYYYAFSYTGSYLGSDSSYFKYDSISLITQGVIHGKDTFTVNGYGTLQLPIDTYSNVLRVTWIKDETDTSYGIWSGNLIPPSESIIRTYAVETEFVSSDFKGPLLDFQNITSFDTAIIQGIKTANPPQLTQNYSYGIDPIPVISTNVSNINRTNDIRIYPNPATNQLILQCSGLQTNAVARIMDMTGRTIISNYVTGSDKFIFDVTSLTAGMYMVEVRQNNVSVTNKFIKID